MEMEMTKEFQREECLIFDFKLTLYNLSFLMLSSNIQQPSQIQQNLFFSLIFAEPSKQT